MADVRSTCSSGKFAQAKTSLLLILVVIMRQVYVSLYILSSATIEEDETDLHGF